MTGIERLRELRGALGGDGHDPSADVSMSAYDLLPQEDREAIAWAREHGGRDEVRMELDNLRGAIKETCARLGVEHTGETVRDAQAIWRKLDWYKARLGESVPRVAYERHLARRQRQIDESHAALRRRNDMLARYMEANKALLKRAAAMKRRLMPEGMEWLLEVWPKWSNGEYCRFGDWWTADKYGEPKPRQLRRLVFYTPEQLREWEQDEGDNFGYEWDFMRPSDTTYHPVKVEPPAPKALDADGVEIRVGDTAYDKDTGEELIVTSFEDDRVWCEHKATDADALPVRGMWSADQLTHERPEVDSWERLEEDAEKDPCGYFGFDDDETCGKCPAVGKNCEQAMAFDLVRRARALAEKEA